jgi:ABC-type nitrate/sulfonate/bicarbonate transport system substrate-binding protein
LTDKRASVAVFRAANNWPLYAAVETKALEDAGIDVEVVHISSSKQQMKGLMDGGYDIIHTAADNVVAVHVEPDFGAVVDKPRIFMGGDDGFLSLHSSRKVQSFGDLNGKRVGFDSTRSGFAFVLKKILATEGLKEGAYEEVVVGGTELRYKALVDGSIDAAMMTPPYDLLCSATGFTRLADAHRYVPRYQGLVGACRPTSPLGPFLGGYKAALVDSLSWLRDKRNKAAAIKVLKDSLQADADSKLFSDLYDCMLSRDMGGFDPSGGVDPEGLQSVATLRGEFSPRAGLRPLSEYLMQP